MTVRIDTFRNQIAATIELLRKLSAEADDLHSLAYDRTRAATDERVRGGSVDYALDTHGDPRARDAYRTLSDTMITTAGDLAAVAHTAIRILRESDHHPSRRQRRHITALEHAIALAAKARRHHRHGSFESHRALPQPERDVAFEALQAAHDQAVQDRAILEAQVAALTEELDAVRAQRNPR